MFKKPFYFSLCHKKWRNQYTDYSDHIYHIKIKNLQEFLTNYHLIFNDKMIEYIMNASEISIIGSFYFESEDLVMFIEGESYIVLDQYFRIISIKNIWLK